MITPKKDSLDIVESIGRVIPSEFHHHYHILYDIGDLFKGSIVYLEIGCGLGRSASLMMHRPNTSIITIDRGTDFSPEVAINNISRFNVHGNSFDYIEGDSGNKDVIGKLEHVLHGRGVDILFIDGGHAYQEVIDDFTNYEGFVSVGGYIVFDDYHDYQYSPRVKHAVDYLKEDMFSDYVVIGTLPNIMGAYSKIKMRLNNCFILKRWQKGFIK